MDKVGGTIFNQKLRFTKFMAEKRSSMDALLEAASLRRQENTAAIQELDRRLTQKLETLTDQVGRLTENVNRTEMHIQSVEQHIDQAVSAIEQQAKTAQTLAEIVQAQTKSVERLLAKLE